MALITLKKRDDNNTFVAKACFLYDIDLIKVFYNFSRLLNGYEIPIEVGNEITQVRTQSLDLEFLYAFHILANISSLYINF